MDSEQGFWAERDGGVVEWIPAWDIPDTTPRCVCCNKPAAVDPGNFCSTCLDNEEESR